MSQFGVGRDVQIRNIVLEDLGTGHMLQCSLDSKKKLKHYEQTLQQRYSHTLTCASFLHSLQMLAELPMRNGIGIYAVTSSKHFYESATRTVQILSWYKKQFWLLFIDTEFQILKLKAEDSSGRQHILTIKLKSKHPAEAPECSADLPVPLALTWTLQSTLDQLHSQFLLVLESLTEFWDVLDEIDSKTWILEPEKPSRSDTMRRIAIGNNVSIKVEVDPRHPKMLPECCLLGAEHAVTPLRNKLNANMHLWKPDSSVLHNLRDVLEIEFPSPATHEKSSFSVECGICYSYRLEAAIPDQVCNDPRCGQPFHQACLYEWLRALPSSRQSFSIVFGECPYCSKPITVKMAAHKS
ncbi:E3 ubiquitin-protein ligase FANCL [Collichthys lucidus]|uniref:E3 ubiquitin-protein ligase FANCL n=1 Tax=Collichthys lucidus TaxID=240159 RepID=A0A4U5VBI5_COLLU|nr:E3 ubiquitin-protein ligase FANCL [Collichthys lucidus]